MAWTPHRWATVWTLRIELDAGHPQCRSQFRRSIESNIDALREAMPSDLLDLIEKTAASDDADKLRQLLPQLTAFAQQTDP
jgi:hypothetical protein